MYYVTFLPRYAQNYAQNYAQKNKLLVFFCKPQKKLYLCRRFRTQ